jgi:hypothetical protein
MVWEAQQDSSGLTPDTGARRPRSSAARATRVGRSVRWRGSTIATARPDVLGLAVPYDGSVRFTSASHAHDRRGVAVKPGTL